jgi:hypothetical protein
VTPVYARTLLEHAIETGHRESFCFAFSSTQVVLGLSDLDLAKMFEISRPTVPRWAGGLSAPHPIGRAAILKHLLKLVNEKISEQENSQ